MPVPGKALWAGAIAGIEAERPAVPAATDGAVEVGALVRGALGRLGSEVSPAAVEGALCWLPGSSTAPAKVSDRRGVSETAMATTVTALTAVAAADNHSVGA